MFSSSSTVQLLPRPLLEDRAERHVSYCRLAQVVLLSLSAAVLGGYFSFHAHTAIVTWIAPEGQTISTSLATSSLTSSSPSCKKAFPRGFRWSVATAAYQVEGGVTLANRTPSIWDNFCTRAQRCDGKQTLNVHAGCEPLACATVADDVFHRYKSDFALMSRMHLSSYRMSLSWSRLMTWDSSKRKMVPNPAGIAFYRDMFHELRRNFIEPQVTLYHWDMPLALEQNIAAPNVGGWLSRDIISHFRDYAQLAFAEFGHLVPMWFTVNEPWTFCFLGYGLGTHAPGHQGSHTESYDACHHVLLSHATAVQLYRQMRGNGEVLQEGRISMVINSDFGVPADHSDQSDVIAAQAYNEFTIDWFLYPLVHGEYPPAMVKRAGGHLPKFTEDEATLVRGSHDGFYGLNHYTTHIITECDSAKSRTACSSLATGWQADLHLDFVGFPSDLPLVNKNPICSWLQGYPKGYGLLLDYVHSRYPQMEILLTENGWCGEDMIDDQKQLWYYQHYVAEVFSAIQRGVPILGYTAWSFMDNYEWGSFIPRFGLVNVNYDTLERVPKTAALWFSKVVESNCLDT